MNRSRRSSGRILGHLKVPLADQRRLVLDETRHRQGDEHACALVKVREVRRDRKRRDGCGLAIATAIVDLRSLRPTPVSHGRMTCGRALDRPTAAALGRGRWPLGSSRGRIHHAARHALAPPSAHRRRRQRLQHEVQRKQQREQEGFGGVQVHGRTVLACASYPGGGNSSSIGLGAAPPPKSHVQGRV